MTLSERISSLTASTAAQLRERWAGRELAILVLTALSAGGVWLFIALADEVLEGDTRAFDRFLLLAMRNPADMADPIGPLWFEAMVRDVTSLGSTFALTLITLIVAGWLLLTRRPHAALLLAVSVGGGTALVNGLKFLFARPRPDLVAHGADVFTLSFPSGHASLSAVVYLTLGALVMRFNTGRALKIYAMSVAILLAVMIGLSRIYLGLHWPTDVLAGWAIGASWAAFIWTVALLLQRSGRVEERLP
ncbi:phosphatase PAP2 family protein [Afifella pfennigii]|uniref:phosphatase PAP2 family protein n=1 Tax=Afifella pfennigii TaxID=209897 RepID=UPI0006906BED|nr:phosphatase PAP2 family protein [Afifella pfennigii]